MRILYILGFGKCIFVTHQSVRCHISDAQYVFHKLLLFVEQLIEETTTPLWSSASSLCIANSNENFTRKLISNNYLANIFNNCMKVIIGNILPKDKDQFFVYNTGFGSCSKYLGFFFILRFI